MAAELPRTAGRPSTARSSRSEFTADLSITAARPLTFCALQKTKARPQSGARDCRTERELGF